MEDQCFDDDCHSVAYFVGPCTCEHEDEQHGWSGCDVDGCECDAGWEE